MTKQRKKFATFFFSCAFILLSVCAVLFALPSKKASAQASAFEMEKPIIRLDEYTGIRYTARLSAQAYSQNNEYYVMIFPYDWFDTYALSHGDDYFDRLINEMGLNEQDVLIMATNPTLQDDGDYVVQGSIYNVKYKNSNRAFFGIAYFQDENGKRTYATETGEEIKSLAQVVTPALLDENAEYTTEEEQRLNSAFKAVYNNVAGVKEDKQKDVQFQINSYQTALSQGDTAQLSVLYAGKLGFPVTWKSADENKLTVDQNGKIEALVNEGSCMITATVYGMECKALVYFRPAMEEIFLEDFSSAGSAYNLNKENCGSNRSGMWGTWLEEFEGAQGVARCEYYKGNNALAVRFNRSAEYLKNLDFDRITVRLWLDYEEVTKDLVTGEVINVNRTHWFKIGSKKRFIPTKEWFDFTVSKNEMISACQGETEAERYADFCEKFSNSGSGRFLFGFIDGKNNIPVYVDSITFGFVDVEEKTKPTQAGETFVLPTAKLVAGNSVLQEDYEVRATVDGVDYQIDDLPEGKAIVVQSGTTSIVYTFVYNGIRYEKTYTFDIFS